MPYYDPTEPPEGGTMLRAADTVGQFCLLRITGEGTYPAKPAEVDPATGAETKKASKAQDYIECDVWVFDRAGFADGTTAEQPTGEAVRYAWWKVVDQLKNHRANAPEGAILGCKPMKETDSNAYYLAKLGPNATELATKLADAIDAAPRRSTAPAAQTAAPADDGWDSPGYEPGEEPF